MDEGAVYGCGLLFGFPFLVWIIIMISLALSTYTPKASLQDLYIPALNTRLPVFNSSTTRPTFIFFDIELENVIEQDEVSYTYINLSLAFYYGRKTGYPIANYSLPGFDQGSDDTAHLRDVVETRGTPWLDASTAASGSSKAAFTVEFAARVKVNREVGHSEEKELLLRGDVEVNGYGEKVRKKAVKLVATT